MVESKVTPEPVAPDVFPEGLLVKSLDDVREPIDPRISISSRPTAEELDLGIVRQLSNLVHPGPEPGTDSEKTITAEDVFYVDFQPGDKRNPVSFPRSKKWVITVVVCFATLIASMTATSYTVGYGSMMRDLNCTELQATIGLSTYVLGFAVIPLVSSSLSEEFGRQPLYIISAVGVFLMYIVVATAKNIQTVIVARFLQGSLGSSWATVVGGTISDLWLPHDRGLPMAIFACASLGGAGIAPLFSGWVEMNPRLGWRWIQWIQMIICGVYLVIVLMVLQETRSPILLMRLARKIRRDTGDNRYRARVEDERSSLRNLLVISCTRPIVMLFTEPVVLSFTLWIGFAWGVTYCIIDSISGVFQTLHGFNIGEVGTVFLVMLIGTMIGFTANFYQEYLYQRDFPTRGPEARLHLACYAAVLVPIAMLIYAWCSFPFVPWIAQAIGLTLYMSSAFTIYLAVFSYLADCYGTFSSSALAGQSLFRNITAAVFPLFIQQMYSKLSYQWANTLFALIAVLMIPIPYALFFYGPAIRKRSRVSRLVLEMQS